MFGIDSPETGQDTGRRAKQAASELAFGKSVTVGASDADRYECARSSVAGAASRPRIAAEVARDLRRKESTRIYHWSKSTGGFMPCRPRPDTYAGADEQSDRAAAEVGVGGAGAEAATDLGAGGLLRATEQSCPEVARQVLAGQAPRREFPASIERGSARILESASKVNTKNSRTPTGLESASS